MIRPGRSRFVRYCFASAGMCLAAVLATMAPLEAWAQIAPPPVRTARDSNGVDLTTGALWVSTSAISVGQLTAGGLAYSRTFDSGAAAWRDNLTGTINSSGANYTVTLFGASQMFTLSAGVFTPSEANGATLAFDAGTNRYTYTARDGAVAIYDKALAGTAPTEANEGRVTSFTQPSGEVQTFTYATLNASTQRLQSLNNNFGYQLKFEYQNNDPLTGGLTLVKVSAINNAIDYCSPTADTCGGFTQTWPSLSFNAALPTEVTDALGRVTRFTYTSGRITGIRRPSSAVNNITIAYNAQNRVSSVSDGAGAWTYAYADASGVRTTTVTDPLTHQRVVTSNIAAATILTDRDALNRTVSYQYDASNRLTRITQPEANYTQLTRDARGNITETRQVAKPGAGLADIVTTAAFSASCASPVTCNQPTSITDPRGFRTDFTYNATHGGVETVTPPAPSGAAPVGSGTRPQTRIAYAQLSAYFKNSGGSIVAAPSPVWLPTEVSSCATTASCANGADETRTVIDYGANSVANNRLPLSVTVRAGDNSVSSSVATTYDGVGNAIMIDGPLSGNADTTRSYFDAARQMIGVVGPDPDGAGALKPRAQRFSYNLDGQVTSVETGNVNAVTDPWPTSFAALETATIAYDSVGRRHTASLVASGTTQAVSQFEYDAASRLICAATRMNPAVFGSLPGACTLSTQGAAGPDRIARYSYNNADQVTQVTSGYGTAGAINEATTTYSANGLSATVADGAGNLTTFEYDGFDRLRRQRYPIAANGATSSSTDYEEYSYNAASAVTQARRRDGQVVSFAYDNVLRVTLMDAPGTVDDVSTTYDLFSRPLSAVKNGQTLSFAYDQLSRLTSFVAAQGTVSYQYDAASRRTRMTWPDGFYVTYDYDLTNSVTAIRENGAASGAGVLASFAYDNLGRRVSLTRGNGAVTSYGFDAASRLASLTHDLPGGTAHDQAYGFATNAASQITQRTTSNAAYNNPAPANGTTAYADNGLNQYTNVAGATPAYDMRGNLTGFAGAAYGYDVFNRLISATPAGGGGATLSYDAAGRLAQVAGASTTRFLYDGADMIAEYNGANVLQRRYVHGPGMDEPLVWYEGVGTSDRRYLISDQLGSIVAANGASTTINAYDEFGVPAAANAGRFQYTGQMWLSEAQLYHYKARAYLPQLGRFAQTDPIGMAGGMNLYAYVGNDPVNFVDPSGLFDLSAPGFEIECDPTGMECEETDEEYIVITVPRRLVLFPRQPVISEPGVLQSRGGGLDPLAELPPLDELPYPQRAECERLQQAYRDERLRGQLASNTAVNIGAWWDGVFLAGLGRIGRGVQGTAGEAYGVGVGGGITVLTEQRGRPGQERFSEIRDRSLVERGRIEARMQNAGCFG